MSLRLQGAVLLLAGAASAQPSPAPSQGFWIAPAAKDAGEEALRDTLARSAAEPSAARAEALRRLADSGTPGSASGLARLAAGLILLDAGRPQEALPLLRHPDLAQTALVDRAFFAVGRALDQAKEAGAAAQAYWAAAEARGDGDAYCEALLAAGDAFGRSGQHGRAIEALTRAHAACPAAAARALLGLGKAHEANDDPRSAAEAYDRLDREQPASAEAKEAGPRLRALAARLPAVAPEERNSRALARGLALVEAGRMADAAGALRPLLGAKMGAEDSELARVRLARALLAQNRPGEAEKLLAAVPAGSRYEAEAAFQLARLKARRSRTIAPYEEVAARFEGSEWGEEALATLANHYQKDARDLEALPYYRRLLEAHPEGRYLERATWRVGWGDYRAGRYEQAAQTLEATARRRPGAAVTPGLLYWAGRARKELGQVERARALFEETVRRFKRSYHGLRAQEALAQLPAGRYSPALEPASLVQPRSEIPPERLARVRELLLIARLDEALEELRALPPSPITTGTIAWIEWRRGRLRPAINTMKRAYPEYVGEAGDRLPEEAWRILYPLEFGDLLRRKAGEAGLDPALVAALVCQESTFDPGAVSGAGARGLMQVMPPTGRTLARALGVTYRRTALHDPVTSLGFGTTYLRQLLDQFEGRVERALAAYNAGPHRVLAWTAARPDIPAEEFVESIPFTETRFYVMSVLASREEYRRIWDLSPGGGSASVAASR